MDESKPKKVTYLVNFVILNSIWKTNVFLIKF